MLIGYSTLTRQQVGFLILAYPFALLLARHISLSSKAQRTALLWIGFTLIYGLWPLRNYVFHQQLVFTKSIEYSRYLQPDINGFYFFMVAFQTGWEPQARQIVKDEEVYFPEYIWNLSKDDSILLRKAIHLSKTCSDGFARLKLLPIIPDSLNCTLQNSEIWYQLRDRLIEKHPLQYYLWAPLSNLKKAIFKISLETGYNSPPRKPYVDWLASVLFFFRSVLIIGGLAAIGLYMYNNQSNWPEKGHLIAMLALYFAIWYLVMCFTYRDINIRYFLTADVMLLVPLGWMLSNIFGSRNSKSDQPSES